MISTGPAELPRRAFMAVIAAGLLGGPLAADGQPAGEAPRIGVLTFAPITRALQDAFRQGLRDHGHVDGRNVHVEWRSADGRTERANTLAAELVRLKVGIIVAQFTPAAVAARNATQTIPIILAPAGDPVTTGLVASLARPGGNVTGFTDIAVELSGKRLDLVRELKPGLTRVGLLIHGADPLDKAFVTETQRAAARAGIQLHVGTAPRAEDLEGAFATMVKERVGAVIVPGNLPAPFARTAQLAIRHRLPSISLATQYAESGGLMSYGASLADIQRGAAGFVDRILKGAKPADLPVERPTKFELVVNLKTARALGVTISPSLLQRADQLIE